MVKPVSISAIEAETNTAWSEWCTYLNDAGANTLEHNGIVSKVHEFKDVSGWWGQTIAIAYEQHIGRRQPGQMSDGTYAASVSRTLKGSLQATHDQWCAFADNLDSVGGQAFASRPTAGATSKRLNWRCKFNDGSNAVLGVEEVAPSKIRAALQHKKLKNLDDIEEKKRVWAALLDQCFKDA